MNLDKKSRIDAIATTAILAAVLFWASGPVFIRFLTGYLDAWSQNLWRYTVAMFFWLPFLIISLHKKTAQPAIFKLAILPALANIVMQTLWAWSFYFVEPGFGALLARSSMIWTMIFSVIYFTQERPLVKSSQFWTGMLMSFAGLIVVIIARESFTAKASMTGIVLILICAVGWSFYSVSARTAFRDIDVRIGFAVVCLYTVIGLAPLALIFGKPAEILQLSAWPWACVIISAVLSIALAHTCYYAAMKRLGAAIPGIVLQLSPFATLVISMAVFGERLNLTQWIGGIILVAGASMSLWAQQHLKKIE